ncbi:Acyl-CoA-binding protein [Zhouia amylolytica]|uniref:Acyl-CoA-binding protein n=1 Tax=Zhouia amylolytica TaxID=376730 RepID=A0A1I6U3R1_9FLAO|nr:acyl-CoA-binding protein [Zhouia amylolytica]SFS96149.1 Acyl-CoA-binding protein [Zhouia amylolytica]
MTDEELDIAFQEAVNVVNSCEEPFPADFLLRLYAYYKKATHNIDPPSSRKALINAFKANALFQTRGISVREAKEKYINLVNDYFNL